MKLVVFAHNIKQTTSGTTTLLFQEHCYLESLLASPTRGGRARSKRGSGGIYPVQQAGQGSSSEGCIGCPHCLLLDFPLPSRKRTGQEREEGGSPEKDSGSMTDSHAITACHPALPYMFCSPTRLRPHWRAEWTEQAGSNSVRNSHAHIIASIALLTLGTLISDQVQASSENIVGKGGRQQWHKRLSHVLLPACPPHSWFSALQWGSGFIGAQSGWGRQVAVV